MVYGRKVTSVDDEHVKLVDDVVHLSSQFTKLSATIFEMLPFCTLFVYVVKIVKYSCFIDEVLKIPARLPGMGMKRHVQKLRGFIDRAVEEPFEEAKARKVSDR